MSIQFNKQYKCLVFLSLLIIVLFACHTVLQNKYILTIFGIMSIGSIFPPIYNILTDIITEVYGLEISMRIYWASNFCLIIFDLLCYVVINMPSPYRWLTQQNGYNFLLEYTLFNFLVGFLFSTVAYRINSYLLIRWKILLKGKYFWLRSLVSTLFGDIIFLILATPAWIWFNKITSGNDAIHLSLSSLILRIIIYVFLAFPCTVISNLLKIIERVDRYDYGIKFNPFKKEKSVET